MPKYIPKNTIRLNLAVILLFISLILPVGAQEEEKKNIAMPITINGDVVEYSTDKKEVTISGNAEVVYKDTKLTCSKLSVNTETKEAVAEGGARLEDKKGVIEGEKIIYNFQNKSGVIYDAQFRANPYFGRAEIVKKVSDAEFRTTRGHVTTCSYDSPHYRLKANQVKVFPGDKIQIKDTTAFAGKIPILYLPQYNHSMKDPIAHVQMSPGKSKDWGPYILTAWRYNLTDSISGRIFLDYREQVGIAEGIGVNYKSANFGKGDYKLYYMQERSRNFQEGVPAEFERYLVRWRHMWEIDPFTNATVQLYKIKDSKRSLHGSQYSILKDFFFREYEKDEQPLSYILMHRTFSYSNLDVILQKRTNRWYSQLEKLPEASYSLPSLQIGETPFYFENSSSLANYNQKQAVPAPSTTDVSMTRFDTVNKFSLPTRVAFLYLTPYVQDRATYYNKDVYGASIPPRNVFYAGADVSTKFFRIFNLKTNFLGLDINNLRHIITPTVKYAYNHRPSISNSKLKQIDGTDSVTQNNSFALELENKLQTKRRDQSVDLLILRGNSTLTIKGKESVGLKSGFSDVLIDLEAIPFSWMRLYADATHGHKQNYFKTVNWDFNLDLGKERTFGFGQRYAYKGGNEITYNLKWRINPKWKFALYHRRNRGHDPTLKRGLREQEYTISRDLHCWEMDITLNETRGKGKTIWLVMRLKAFPEIEFEFNQSYHAPKPGSQSNP